MNTPGFSVLAWVKGESRLIQNLQEAQNQEDMEKQLLTDFKTLLGVRWGMDFTIITLEGKLYCYGSNAKFTVSNNTILTAMGSLREHVDFIRGSAYNNAEDLHAYKACKTRWQVPETTSDSAYGWADQGQAETSVGPKRRRY